MGVNVAPLFEFFEYKGAISRLLSQVTGPSWPSEPARARTEDPKIKSLLLYQLSYGLKLHKLLALIIP
jgi:hypothetical protein